MRAPVGVRLYVLLSGAFGVALAGALAVAKRSGRELDRPGAVDIVLAGLATQKVSRLLAKDKVTSLLRAPFTRFDEPSGHGELSEEPRGSGMRYAVGELLVAELVLLSDCSTAALVTRQGTVEWWPGPRFDGPSVFSRLLDDDAGHFRVAPADRSRSIERSYLDGTLVLHMHTALAIAHRLPAATPPVETPTRQARVSGGLCRVLLSR